MKFLSRTFVFTTIALSISLPCRFTFAQWSNNPSVNNVMCAVPSNYPAIVSDGIGGAFIAWEDHRDGSYGRIYAQHMSAGGVILWGTDGIAIDSSKKNETTPIIASDGAGGAIIAWLVYPGSSDYRYLYAQRINASGIIQWTSYGIPIDTTSASTQSSPSIAYGGTGGAVFGWLRRTNGIPGVFAQRVNGTGTIMWTSNGVAADTNSSNVDGVTSDPNIVSDESGGAVITWIGFHGTEAHPYAQHINAAGTVQWLTNGLVLCTAKYGQQSSATTSDGSGGAITAWVDYRTQEFHIYAQHVNAAGTLLWGNGAPIDTAFNLSAAYPTITSDGSGGAFLAWYRDNTYNGINGTYHAQRVSGNGDQYWTVNGVSLYTVSAQGTLPPAITSDGVGGAIITWGDSRNGINNLFAQQVNVNGAIQWTLNGAAICTAAPYGQAYQVITSDSAGGAIIAWQDMRNLLTVYSADIYAQRINNHGTLATGVLRNTLLPETTVLRQNYPNPFNPTTNISFTLTSKSFVSLKVFDLIGREVATIVSEEMPTGSYSKQWNASNMSSGIYFYRLQAGSITQTKKLVLIK